MDRPSYKWLAMPIWTLALAISACNHSQDKTALSHIPAPANPRDIAAWEAYMLQVTSARIGDKAARPYLFLVPFGDEIGARDRRRMIQQVLSGMASRNNFPGTMIAVGGPNPQSSADVLVMAFDHTKPGSLQNLTVFYVGDDGDKTRVENAITKTGATLSYVKI